MNVRNASGTGSGGTGKRGLAADVQRLAARREDLRLDPRLQEFGRELGARLQQMLAVVEHDQHATVLDEPRQGLGDRSPGLLLYAYDGSHRLGDEPWIGQRRELDQPDSVRVLVHHAGGDLQRQPRFADAAGARQRDEPGLRQELRDLRRARARGRRTRSAACGRLWGVAVSARSAGNSARSSGCTTWYTRSALARSRSRTSPRSRRTTPSGMRAATSAATVCDIRIWPPWAIAMMRAARLTERPK